MSRYIIWISIIFDQFIKTMSTPLQKTFVSEANNMSTTCE